MALLPIEVEVYAHDDPDTLIDVLNGRISPTYLEEIRGPGGGSVRLSIYDPKLIEDPTLVSYRNVLRIKMDGAVIGALLVQKKNTAQIDDDASQESIIITGESLRSWLNDAVVRPFGGLKPKSRKTRYFNFAAESGPWYDPTKWVTPKNLSRQGDTNTTTNPKAYFPAEWPDAPNAWWMWAPVGTIQQAPPGTVYFRSTFNVTTAGAHSFFFTVDDLYEVYLDGELLTDEGSVWSYAWKTTKRIDFDLTTGTHVIALKAGNTDWPFTHNPGGVIAALFRAGDSSTPSSAQIIMQSGDSTWKCLPYPTFVPGWTPGEIMLTLLDEAEARGVRFPTFLTPTFTNTHDSNGVPWERGLDWSFTVGESLASVVEKLEEMVCEVWIDPATLTFNMAGRRGTNRAVYGTTPQEVTNHVTDPSFETFTGPVSNAGSDTFSDTTWAESGAKSIRIHPKLPASYSEVLVSGLTPGQTYTVVYKVRRLIPGSDTPPGVFPANTLYPSSTLFPATP